MRKIDGNLLFAPTDLARFMRNPYVPWMDRLYLEYSDQVNPDETSDEDRIIADLGLDHERRFLEKLRAAGCDICEVSDGPMHERASTTVAAMHDGRDVIYQGALDGGRLSGLSDFLIRVDDPSDLGDWSYEVWDTKLAKKARPYFLVQLCCYADILEVLQGRRPGRVVVVTGDGRERAYRTDDYFFYYACLKGAFLEQQASFDPRRPPEPLREGRNGRWETEAKEWLERVDHLSRVANIRTDQIKKLRAAGVGTLRELAETSGPVPRLRPATLDKLRGQARLQLDSTGLERPLYQVTPTNADDPRRGLALLPPPSPSDVAFDIEGYPLVEDGLEYLLGAVVKESGQIRFYDWWAHDSWQEKRAFEAFIDWAHGRWQEDPSMHVYHYASYEVTAMRRLMGKYGTREREVDDLLRNEVFVDLYKVVHQGLRVGVPSYSLKMIERLYLDARVGDVATAGESIVFYQKWLENPDGDDWRTSKTLREIREYNEEDCISTWKLIEWLSDVRQEAGIQWLAARDVEEPKKEKEETESAGLARELLAAIPEDRSGDPERWRVHELLAWLLEFHWREEKPMWWRVFDRRDTAEDQLREDLDCLAGLRRTSAAPRRRKRSTIFEFDFDTEQDTKICEDDPCYFAHDLTPCSVFSMDDEAGRIELKVGPKALRMLEDDDRGVPDRLSIIPNEYVSAASIVRSICEVAHRYRESGELPSPLADLLYRRRPRVLSRPDGPLDRPGESGLETARVIVPELNETTLCIQGPPGTGKTFTGGT